MSFLSETRERRRDTKIAVQAAKARAKEEAKADAKLKRQAQKEELKRERRQDKVDNRRAARLGREELRAQERDSRRTSHRDAKIEYRTIKRDNHALKTLDKISKRQEKEDAKLGKKKLKFQKQKITQMLEQQQRGAFDRKRAQGWVSGARVLVPLVLPLLYRGMTVAQQKNIDSEQKQQNGAA